MSLHDTPAITIVIPNFNHVNLIQNAIDSIANDNYLNKQVVIVDDGSSDGSPQKIFDLLTDKKNKDIENIPVLEGLYKNVKINLIACNKNSGSPTAKNIAIRAFLNETDAYCFLDSDDLIINNKLEECSNIIRKSWGTVGCIYNDCIEKDLIKNTEKIILKSPSDLKTISENYEIVSNSVIPKYVFEKIGIFDEELIVYENNELSKRIKDNYLCYHIPKILNLITTGKHCYINNISKFLLFDLNNKIKEILNVK